MDIGDVIKLANNVGLSLIYTENDLKRELASYDREEMAEDRDFLKYLADTTVQCTNCGVWQRPDDVKEYECCGC